MIMCITMQYDNMYDYTMCIGGGVDNVHSSTICTVRYGAHMEGDAGLYCYTGYAKESATSGD